MLVSKEELSKIRQKHTNQRIVLGTGVFDLLHVGQLKYIQALKEHGDIVVILVKPDVRVRRYKGDLRPIIPETDRALMVDALKGVDYVYIGPEWAGSYGDVEFLSVVETLKPDVFVTANESWNQLKTDQVPVVVLPRFNDGWHESTSAIIEHIRTLP